MMRMRLVALGLVLGTGCAFAPEGLDVEPGAGGAVLPPAAPQGGAPPVAPQGGVPAAPVEETPPAQPVMRVRDVEANRIEVGVLFARKVEAKNGEVASSGPPLPAAELAAQVGADDVEVPHLVVDVLYADEVKAKTLSVRELHAIEVKIGKGGQGEDD